MEQVLTWPATLEMGMIDGVAVEALPFQVREMEGKPKGKDPFQEVNTGLFLESLLSGGKASQRAFRRLTEITHPFMARFVGKYFRCQETAQEVVQEVYLGVYKALPNFRGGSKLSTWMYSLAYHKVCDRLTEEYRRKKWFSSADGGEDGLAIESDKSAWEDGENFPQPDEALWQSTMSGIIEEASQSLHETLKQVYQLRDRDGLSGEETAAVLGISPLLVRVRLHRARGLIVEKARRKLNQGK